MKEFKDFVVISRLYEKSNSKVDHVKPSIPNSITPQEYVVKRVGAENALKEANIHKKLSESDPNILKYLYGWQNDEYYYHCIEYCEKGNLYEFLKSSKRLIFAEVLSFCIQITETVKSMHKQNVCHRDIKALNIFLTKDLKLKLGDFGFSKELEKDENQLNTMGGTKPYLAPELQKKMNNKSQTNNPYRDDIWALGKTFLEIYLGEILIQKITLNEIYEVIDENLESHGSIGKFASLMKKMICDENCKYIKASSVLKKLKSISELRSCESIERFKRDPDDLTLDLDSINSPDPKSFKELRSDFYSKGEKKEVNFDENAKAKIKKQLNFTGPIMDISIFAININQKISVPDDEEEEKKNFLQVSVKSDNKKKLFDSEKYSFMAKNSKKAIFFINDIKEQNLLEINRADSIIIMPSIIEPTAMPETLVSNICCNCSLSISSCRVKIHCGHCYHSNCFVELFELRLRKAKKKVDFFVCFTCSKPIPFENFFDTKLFSNYARKNSYLQMFAHMKFICPRCNITSSKKFCLNQNLKFYDVKCKICTSRFCSFCQTRGSHYFSCSVLNNTKIDIKKSALDIE